MNTGIRAKLGYILGTLCSSENRYQPSPVDHSCPVGYRIYSFTQEYRLCLLFTMSLIVQQISPAVFPGGRNGACISSQQA